MEKRRTPILYLAPWVDLGGSDKGTIDWFKHVDRRRWAPSLITTQPSPNRWLHKVEPFAEEVWDLPDLMPGAMFPEFILGFIESREVRVVHIMNSRLGFDLLPDVACVAEPPAVVVQMHAEEPNQAGYVRYATRRYGNLIDAFSVTSEHLKETVAEYEIPPSRIEVIHSGVDGRKEFDPERVEPLRLDDDGPPRVLWPGRLVEQKDPMLTLDVLAAARKRGGEFVLDIVGDGHMKPAVEARAEELGVGKMIRWHPPSHEIPRWYRSADLLLMTSVYEGVPYVIYESLAMGVPVIAPALPGNREFMDAESGALIEPRDDADGYAEAIVRLLSDAEQRRSMGERSRQRMLAEFSLEQMGRRHDELYERLVASRPASSRWRSGELSDGTELEGRGDGESSAPATDLRPALARNPAPERTVGVIVPCFRHGIFLDECIRSVKAQTLPPARIVVVDDGSDDPETMEALERVEADDEVTVVRQSENRGPSAARNRALAELETSYVLPIDADDALLPDALERMVARLEGAPENVGFVYPHVQHMGNRSDYVPMPAYNLWLLMKENYCPAPALFDRRVFTDLGAEYPEDIVVGHEDWDLVLQLAEHGVHGLHADGPTFLYRRLGFSRINAVEYGPHEFHESIQRRHPSLYANCDEIKAQWAPALSLILLDLEDESWSGVELAGLSRQTCRDFEILASADLGGDVRAVGSPSLSRTEWMQVAIYEARGRWVGLLTPATARILDSSPFVEQLLTGFVASEEVTAIALATAPKNDARHGLTQLDDVERTAERPAGIVFERPPNTHLPTIDLQDEDSALLDLTIGLQATGNVVWRLVPSPLQSRDAPIAKRVNVVPIAVNLRTDRLSDWPSTVMRDMVLAQAPRLPELTTGTVRRWKDTEAWSPPETQPLCRFVQVDGKERVLSNDRKPPRGYEMEYELGAIHKYAAPGTRRLVQVAEQFELSDDQDELDGGRLGYGYVEQQPLPLLEHLELRRMPDTGKQVLVAGPDDPLYGVAEPVTTLGWIEACPILPRHGPPHAGPVGATTLWRWADLRGRRHRYGTKAPDGAPGHVALGSLFAAPGSGRAALRLRKDDRLVTELAQPGRASRDPRKIWSWVTSPLSSPSHTPFRGMLAVGARLAHITRHFRARKLTRDDGTVLGWLEGKAAAGTAPLISCTHPASGDQFVTCFPQEAIDLGYLPDGILGYILKAGANRVP